MPSQNSFRVGRVTVYRRGRVWYLRYHEHGRRRQVRAADDKSAARQLAAQVNAQLESGAVAATSFEPITLSQLRQQWLDHHEHVLRSSPATVNRYRTATEHLIRFTSSVQPMTRLAHFDPARAEAFVRHLRQVEVAPNGHPNARQRRLRDKGVKFVLEVCRTMFNFALKRRHLPPYSQNPFTTIEIDRIPIENAKPIILLTTEQEQELLAKCDVWQLPIFVTLMLTGMRPGELTHLLVSDVDLDQGWLQVRNKPELGWKVKTRNERRIPLPPELVEVFRLLIRGRTSGPLLLRRRFQDGKELPRLHDLNPGKLQSELTQRLEGPRNGGAEDLPKQNVIRRFWSDMGAVKPERIRLEFMRLTAAIGVPQVTAPKTLRHGFATALQDANVDPLIRMQLMGHSSSGQHKGHGPLGMTGVYTHSREQTIRNQLARALARHPAIVAATQWCSKVLTHPPGVASDRPKRT